MNGVLIFVCPVLSRQLKACHSVRSSCNNKRPSSVLECKIPEGLSRPWSSEHDSRQPVFANGASYNTSSSRRWSEWNWLHFPQHWGVYGIRAKWKLTGKWHIWRYIKMLFYVLFLSLSSSYSSVSVIRLWAGCMRNHHPIFCRQRNFRSCWQPAHCRGGRCSSLCWQPPHCHGGRCSSLCWQPAHCRGGHCSSLCWHPPHCRGGCCSSLRIGGRGAFVRGKGASEWSWLTHVWYWG